MRVKCEARLADLSEETGMPKQRPKKTIHQACFSEKVRTYLCSLFCPVDLFIVGSVLVQVMSTWISGMPYLCLERLYPQLIARWKIQPQVLQTRQNLRSVLIHVLEQHTLLLLGGTLATKAVKLLDIRPVKEMAEKTVNAPLPSVKRLLFEMMVNLLTWEVVFYSSHRLLHTRRLYRTIHKKHHVFKAPVSLCSNYAENFEHVLGNIVPGLAGPVINQVINGSNLVSHWVWIAFGAWLTNVSHSGYAIPFNPFLHCTLAHEYHHLTFYHQMGTLGLMDKICGTDGGQEYNKWRTKVADRIFQGMPFNKAFAQLCLPAAPFGVVASVGSGL